MTQLNDLIASEFPQSDDLIYLNHAAVSPWPARTAAAVKEFADENVITGAKHYPAWVKKESLLRQLLQQLLNAPSADDIALLKNTSEALSVVACGLPWQSGDNVVSTDQEFPSNRIVWQAQSRHGVDLREVDILHADEPEQALMSTCDGHTRILAVSSVQFGTGFRLDLECLGRFCRQNNILFCVDAIQSIGAYTIDVQKIQADFVMADAHKWMLGPEGIAVFYCNSRIRDELQLNQYGWHMVEESGNYDRKDWEVVHTARRFECGSPNMLGIHALGASLSLIEAAGIDTIEAEIRKKIDYLINNLSFDARIHILTPLVAPRRAGILTFTVDGLDMADLHRKLMAKNIVCAYRAGGIRFSPHFYTHQEKINKTLEIIKSNI